MNRSEDREDDIYAVDEAMMDDDAVEFDPTGVGGVEALPEPTPPPTRAVVIRTLEGIVRDYEQIIREIAPSRPLRFYFQQIDILRAGIAFLEAP
jgi:hypothetical protein